MVELSSHPNCFIRPSPTGGSLGGVARRTHEAISLCEAAGYDIIIIETVGVGQSEVLASSLSDMFVVLQLPNSGDDLQGMKKGILEIADLILINKADGNLKSAALRAKAEIQAALQLLMHREDTPRVMTCSALENAGILEVHTNIQKLISQRKQDGSFLKRRKEQALEAFDQGIKEELLGLLESNQDIHDVLKTLRQQVVSLKVNRSLAIERLYEDLNIQVVKTLRPPS